jgi:hypothetical protein
MALVGARQIDASAEHDMEVLRDLAFLEQNRPRAEALDTGIFEQALSGSRRYGRQHRDFNGQRLEAAGAIRSRDDFREVIHARALFVTNWAKAQLLSG